MAIYSNKFKNVYSERREEGDNTLDVALHHNACKRAGLCIVEVCYVAPDGKPTYRKGNYVVQAVQGNRSQCIRQAIAIFDDVDIEEAVKAVKPTWEMR